MGVNRYHVKYDYVNISNLIFIDIKIRHLSRCPNFIGNNFLNLYNLAISEKRTELSTTSTVSKFIVIWLLFN